jgi:hypothetical protein
MPRKIMKNAALAGQTWTGPTEFPTGVPPKPEPCVYRVDEDGLASINEEDQKAAEAAGFTSN